MCTYTISHAENKTPLYILFSYVRIQVNGGFILRVLSTACVPDTLLCTLKMEESTEVKSIGSAFKQFF